MSPDSDNEARKLAEGIRHMKFVTRLCHNQVEGGRIFVHENLAHAKSRAPPCIKRMAREAGVHIVQADQCMFGQNTWGHHKSQLVLAKKPTKFVTNSQTLGRELIRKCDGNHDHQQLVDGRAKGAARYPPALCRALCRGILKEKMQRATCMTAMLSVREGVHMNRIDL